MRQALQGYRLEDVIHRAMLKGGNGMGVQRGHKDQMGAPPGMAGKFQSAEAGQLDVNEQNVGTQGFPQREALGAISGLANNLQFGPQRRQKLCELCTRIRLVFYQQCPY